MIVWVNQITLDAEAGELSVAESAGAYFAEAAEAEAAGGDTSFLAANRGAWDGLAIRHK